MKRSIPVRGSIAAIDSARLSLLTDWQRLALAQIVAWEKLEAKERELRLVSSDLGLQNSQEAGQILLALAGKELPRSPVTYFLISVGEGLLEGQDPVCALEDGLAAYFMQSVLPDCFDLHQGLNRPTDDAPEGGQK